MVNDQDNQFSADNIPSRKTLEPEVKDHKDQKLFADARLLLEDALKVIPKETEDYIWAMQQRALCTYKDTHLRPGHSFKDALDILKSIGLFDPSNSDPETLGLGGAIYKRMWELDGNEAHLRASLGLYRAAWERNREGDKGYCGGNAAYILDQLAYLAEKTSRHTGGDNSHSEQLRKDAIALREDMAKSLDKLPLPDENEKTYWHYATLAEIHFGLNNFGQAVDWLVKAKALPVGEWMFESTAKQLIDLARWRNLNPAEVTDEESNESNQCRKMLALFLGDKLDAALGGYRGKVGLALSGGGFRAAFYHLGVLARLAEMDVLRHVEVLSTVSGGSIVGVHYYLELKQLLETKPDQTIVREDYIAIIKRVQENFRKSVQRNLRMRILANLVRNLRMNFSSHYTRSHRIGELYEKEIYSKVADGNSSCRPRTMPSLLVTPSGDPSSKKFNPREQNRLRAAKVPQMVINSTSLNSGHNFQFTASWLGEPPGLTGYKVDMNVRHRRLYYGESINNDVRDFRLGYAVAASSCVPGMFDPLVIDNLYPGRTIKLVDGGVHDNQGVAGLLDEDCDFIICSDASGQMHDEINPPSSFIGVPLRSNDILQDRVRECEYEHLKAMATSGRLKGLFFIHLKKDLAQEDIGWIGSPEKVPQQRGNQTPYGIDRDIQRALSEIRTDLDSFSEVEANSLMLSGYLMAEEHAKHLSTKAKENGETGTWGGFAVDAPRSAWPFLKLAPVAAKPHDSSDLRRHDLEKQLKVGKEQFLKAWRLVPWLKWLGYGLVLLAIAGLAALVYWQWFFLQTPRVSLWELLLAISTSIAVIAVPALALLTPRKTGKQILLKLLLAVFGWLLARLHLLLIDPLFLRRGRTRRLLNLLSKEDQ